MRMGGEELFVGQIRAARAWLGWTQGETAKQADIERASLARYETHAASKVSRQATENALVAAYERGGVVFVDNGVLVGQSEGRGDGLRLPEHLRAGRAWLGWKQRDLAEKAGVGISTIKRIELKPGEIDTLHSIHLAFEEVFQKHGIRFVENGILFEAPEERQSPKGS